MGMRMRFLDFCKPIFPNRKFHLSAIQIVVLIVLGCNAKAQRTPYSGGFYSKRSSLEWQ